MSYFWKPPGSPALLSKLAFLDFHRLFEREDKMCPYSIYWYIDISVFLRYTFSIMSNARPTDIFNLCQYKFANGRLCGLPAHPKGDGLCFTHFRYVTAEAKPKPPVEADLSADLCSPAGDYITQIDINHVLGKLFDALAANRISNRRATSLAYIACLITQTQKGAKDEARRWEVDLPDFKKLLRLKYPKNHPNHPAPDKDPDKPDSSAKPCPTGSAPKASLDRAPVSVS
jgi:hypothetical protein